MAEIVGDEEIIETETPSDKSSPVTRMIIH